MARSEKAQEQRTQKYMPAAAVIATAVLTILDLNTPLGYGEWALYVLPVLMVSSVGKKVGVFSVLALILLSMVLGLFFSPPGLPLPIAALNRIAGYAVIWIIALVILSRNESLAREWEASADRDRLLAENSRQREFLELVLDVTPVGIAVVRGRDYRYEYANPAYAVIPGKSTEQITGDTVSGVFPDYVAGGGLELINQTIQENKPIEVSELETYVGFEEGRRLAYFNVTFVPLDSGPGKESGVIIVANEITDAVTSRKKVERTAARDEAILSNINDGLAIMASDGTIEYMNEVGLRIDGYENVEEVRRKLDTFGNTWRVDNEAGEELPVEQWPLARALRESFRNVVYRVRRLDCPLEKFCSYSGKPVTDAQGNRVGAVATFQDITKSKRTEQLLRQREQEYKTLAENSPEVIARFDRELRHTYVNDYGAKVYGMQRKDVLGKTNEELGMPPEKVRYWEEHFQKVIATGQQQVVNFEFVSPTFGTQYFSSLFVPEFDGHHEIVSILAITRDITDVKRAEQSIRQSENRLRILNENLESLVVQRTEQVHALSKALTMAEQRERKRFSYILHENLQQLLLGVYMLLQQHLRDHQEDRSEGAYDDITHAASMLNDALNTARTLSIELNPPILQTQGLDAALEWLARHMAKTYGLKVDIHLRGHVGKVRGETQLMLTQMVRELLNNVHQHSGADTARVDVECGKRLVRIKVSDPGQGFEERRMSEAEDETHMGLFSIRERLKLFGGSFKVRSEPGKGTTIELMLPYEYRE